MKRRLVPALLATALLTSITVTSAWAQEDGENAEAEAVETEAVEVEEVEVEEEDGAVEVEVETEEGEVEAEVETESEAGAPVLGPGGKPLRTDYPGTEESLRSQMETNRVQGIPVDPERPEAAYGLQIKELETKIDDLKEKVFQSKTRIVLLRETLLSGNLAGSRAIIIHRNELGSAFDLRQAMYSLDGTRVFSEVDEDDSLADRTTFEVYNGAVTPGNHNLSIFLKYQGSGYGLFSYFEGYEWDTRSSCEFRAQEGKLTQVKVITYEKGGASTPVEDRFDIRCEVQLFDNVQTEPEGSEPIAGEAAE